MQNVTNDIKSENLEKNHSSVSNAIKNSSETLAHVLNFTRKNLNNLIVIKKDGTQEKYNIQKVVDAIKKSATRMMVTFSDK